MLSVLLCMVMFVSVSPFRVFAESEAELAAIELPVYKDGVFYGARTGKVTEIDANYLSNGKTVTIQNSVNGHAVTAIEDDVLWNNQYSLNLVIPETVTSIGTLGNPGDLKNVTIVAEEGSAARQYAQNHSLQTITPEENQRMIDSKNVSNKLITVYYNEGKIFKDPDDDQYTNHYVIGKSSGLAPVKIEVEDAGKRTEVSLDKSGVANIRASDVATLTVSKSGYVTQKLNFKDLITSGEVSNNIYLEPEGEIYIKNVWLIETENNTEKKYDAYHHECIIDRTKDEATVLEAEIDWNGKTPGTIQLSQSGSTFTFSGNRLTQVIKQKMDTA